MTKEGTPLTEIFPEGLSAIIDKYGSIIAIGNEMCPTSQLTEEEYLRAIDGEKGILDSKDWIPKEEGQ